MFNTFDRIRQKTVTGGTGDLTLTPVGGNVLNFLDVLSTGTSFPYCVVEPNTFEVGLGHINVSGKLTRDIIISSSSFQNVAGVITFNRINFTQGIQKDVFLCQPSAITPTLPSVPITGFTGSKLLNYSYSSNYGGYVYGLNSFDQISTPSFANNCIIFAENGQLTTNNNWQFDPVNNIVGLTGNIIINGNLESSSKAFNIPHPILPNTKLLHGCLEGPEHGMYQRFNFSFKNTCKIDLPDYFKYLTTNLSVFITTEKNDSIKYKLNDNKIILKSKWYNFKTVNGSMLVWGSRTDVEFNLTR